MKPIRVSYTYQELCEEVPSLSEFKKETISKSIKKGILSIVDEWAEKNGLELFSIITPYGDCVSFIFNKTNMNVEKQEANFIKPKLQLETAYTIPASKLTDNGLIEFSTLIDKHYYDEGNFTISIVALNDVKYDDKIIVSKGKTIRHYSNFSNNSTTVMDLRPTSASGNYFIPEKLSDVCFTMILNKKI